MNTPKILALAAIGTSFLLLLAVVVFRSPQHVQTTIDLLKVLSAWPPILLGLALYFMHRYHDEIRSFLSRATEVGPSGIKAAEKQLPPPEPPPAELARGETPPEPLPTSGEGQKQLTVSDGGESAATSEQATPGAEAPTSAAEELKDQKTVTLPEDLLKKIMREYSEARVQRESWKLQFLDQFLVYNTKNVLAWFASIPSSTLSNYHRTWRHTIPDEDQRATLIDVLLEYGLLSPTPAGLQITDEGRRALEYFRERGLPFTPPKPAPLDPKVLEALSRAMGQGTALKATPLDPKVVEALSRAMGQVISTEQRETHPPNRYLDALRAKRPSKEPPPPEEPSSGTAGEGS